MLRFDNYIPKNYLNFIEFDLTKINRRKIF